MSNMDKFDVLTRIAEIVIVEEDDNFFLAIDDHATDYFDTQDAATAWLADMKEVADSLSVLARLEHENHLAMVDSWGTPVHAEDIHMNIDMELWIDGKTDNICFVDISSNQAIKDFLQVLHVLYNNTYNPEWIMPVRDDLPKYLSNMVLQYDDKSQYLELVEAPFLEMAVRHMTKLAD